MSVCFRERRGGSEVGREREGGGRGREGGREGGGRSRPT